MQDTQLTQEPPVTRDAQPSRRQAFTCAAALLATVPLAAACSSGSSGGSTPAASGGSNTAAAAAGTAVAKLADVPVGKAIIVNVAGNPLVIARPSETEVVSFSGYCTHQGFKVQVDSSGITCPLHGSTYNELTGAATGQPATVALRHPGDPSLPGIPSPVVPAVKISGADIVTA